MHKIPLNPKSYTEASKALVSSDELPLKVDTVVVGGGVIGSSITYHLAKAGIDVMLMESRALAGVSSGANMGMITVSMKRPAHYAKLSLASARLYPKLIKELDNVVSFTQEGTIYLIEGSEIDRNAKAGPQNGWQSGENLSDIVQRFETLKEEVGLKIVPISRATVEKQLTFMPAKFSQAFFCPEDCWVNPLQLTVALVRTAQRLGARVITGTPITEIKVKNQRIEAIQTDHGRVQVEHAVLAAGIGLSELLKPLNVDIPIRPNRGHVLVTEAVPFNLGPAVVHISKSGELTVLLQTDRGNLLIGTTHEIGMDSTDVNLELASDLAHRSISIFPILAELQLIRIWAGVRPWPKDVMPIIHRFDLLRGLQIITSHSGVGLAPILGHIVAELMTKGISSLPLGHYSLERFQNR